MNLNKLSKIKSAILILGETGTGKTTLARRIHLASNRQNKNFVTVNLAGLSDELFRSELFGHRKGSFTGAYNDKRGYCDVVGGGTIFLDEIGDLTPIQQKYLLKLIDEKKYHAVGDLEEKIFAGTIIMATHKNLEKLVEQGVFREDLYFRIRVFTKKLLPLRDQIYQIAELINSNFIQLVNSKNINKRMSEGLLEVLMGYEWPGNYRELKNTLEYLIMASESELIGVDSLPDWIQKDIGEKYKNYYYHQCEFEKKYLIKQLALTGGKINETARKIGLSKVTLIAKIKKYTIDLEYIKIINQVQLNLARIG